MRAVNSQILSNADASADQASAAVPSSQIFYISAQAVVTGTSTGTLKLQFSNDACEGSQSPVPTNWNNITGATVTISGAGTYAILKTELSYRFVRAVFTHTNAAAGTITAVINGMGN